MHCKGANPHNCCHHEHCREKTFSDFPSVLFHPRLLQGSSPFVKKKNKRIIFAHSADVGQLSGSASTFACRWPRTSPRSLSAKRPVCKSESSDPLPARCGSLRCEPCQRRAAPVALAFPAIGEGANRKHARARALLYFGASEAMIASKRGSPRSGSQSGLRRKWP
jgi:hypothetical protein